jgi:hypothetical protein
LMERLTGFLADDSSFDMAHPSEIFILCALPAHICHDKP